MDNENTKNPVASEGADAEPKTETPLKTADQTKENDTDKKTESTSEVAGGTSGEVKPKPPAQKAAPTKRKRKKPPKDANAPKHPLTGYVRYMNEHRDAVRQKHPTLSHMDLTKLMAEDWSKLPEDKKKPYLEAAEADKIRYNKEIQEYKLKKPPIAQSKPDNATPATAAKDTPAPQTIAPAAVAPYVNGRLEQKVIRRGDYDIPIFTEDFLDHNKVIESELRTLRKSNIDYEQQNSVLEKHVENMENGIQKLDSESCALDARNAVLESYLQKLKISLANAFQGFPLGGECRGASLENIDQYLADLHQMADSSTQGHTLNKAKDIIRKLDLQKLGL
uniref:Putative nucleosome-binding factor spn pob3 subunit n=1 Tax=Anopheles triannulatus TaxID=58253 RepID=A0A2M4ASV7_9DIPT